jgi:hypothetical protein
VLESPENEECANHQDVFLAATRTALAPSARGGIRIVTEGVRGEISVAELCRREDMHPCWLSLKWRSDVLR